MKKKNEPQRGRPPTEGETATDKIHLRVKPSQKQAYVEAAKPRNLTVWALEVLDQAAK